MKKWTSAVIAAFLGLTMATAVQADPKEDARELVDEALYTVKKMSNHERHGAKVKHYMKNAKAVFVVPELLKGALFVGGEGGSGVLLARADNGVWSYPAFFDMGAGSFGLQVGAQSSELMLIVMTGKGLSAILDNKVKLGGDLSAAVGPIGEGVEASTTTNMGADVIAYSTNKGAFLGASVDGAVIWADHADNMAYYDNTAATPKNIVLNGQYANPHADKLRELLASFPAN